MNISETDLAGAREALHNILKSTLSLNASHDRMHKAHSDAHAVHKACHGACQKCSKAHESARLNRLDHKTLHQEHVTKVHDAVSKLHKVLGGGPELAALSGSEPAPVRVLATQKRARDLAMNKNARLQSPFDAMATEALKKTGVQSLTTRRSPNMTNPMWSGR